MSEYSGQTKSTHTFKEWVTESVRCNRSIGSTWTKKILVDRCNLHRRQFLFFFANPFPSPSQRIERRTWRAIQSIAERMKIVLGRRWLRFYIMPSYELYVWFWYITAITHIMIFPSNVDAKVYFGQPSTIQNKLKIRACRDRLLELCTSSIELKKLGKVILINLRLDELSMRILYGIAPHWQ